MNEREKTIREVLARAKVAGKGVYGYCSDKAGCQLAVKEIPADWDRICVAGDKRWTALPVKEAGRGIG